MKNQDMPAMPVVMKAIDSPFGVVSGKCGSSDTEMLIPGLTKLEYAAIMICAGGQTIPGRHNLPEAAAVDAMEKAKALLTELEKEQSSGQ